jgi:hypothetical protein
LQPFVHPFVFPLPSFTRVPVLQIGHGFGFGVFFVVGFFFAMVIS